MSDVSANVSSADEILFPTSAQIDDLSAKVGGLVFVKYSFQAKDLESSRKMAIQIATGQTLGYVHEDLAKYWQYVGRVVSFDFSDGRGGAKIAFPQLLFGSDIAGLLTVIFGKISFSPGIRLETITADDLFLQKLKGPKFGLSGIKRLAGVEDAHQPLLMAILKPGLGPSDDPIANQFGRLVSAGTNLVKDDETRIDLKTDDALSRLQKIKAAGQGRGLYVMHLSGPAFEIKARALKLQAAGAQAFLFCPYTYGISILQSLCEDPQIKVPIFAHPAFTGIMGQGVSSIAPQVSLGTLLRWAGCDGVLFPSPYGSIALSKEDAQSVHHSLVKIEGELKVVASVPSAGIMPEFVEKIRSDFGVDVVVNAGTGMARTGANVEDGAKAFIQEIRKYYS